MPCGGVTPILRGRLSTELSQDLQSLLERALDTFEKLELVLVLRGAAGPLSISDLAVQLQVGRDALRRVAVDVADSGIVEMVDGDAVRLRPGTWDSPIAEAAAIYETDPTRLMRCLSSIAMEKIRGLAARTFADAFRIRKK